MKILCTTLIILILLSANAHARLGESLKEIKKRYGNPLNYSLSVKTGFWRYDKPGLMISVLFNRKKISIQEQIYPYRVQDHAALSDREINDFIYFTSGKRETEFITLPQGRYIVDSEGEASVPEVVKLTSLRVTVLPEGGEGAIETIAEDAWNHPDNVRVRVSKDKKITVIELLGRRQYKDQGPKKFVMVIDEFNPPDTIPKERMQDKRKKKKER